jgi:hypothetical protein
MKNGLNAPLTEKQRAQLELEKEILNAEIELIIAKQNLLVAKLIDLTELLDVPSV